MVTRERRAKRQRTQVVSARWAGASRRPRINPKSLCGKCSERLRAVGRPLPLVKFLHLLGFEAAFAEHYVRPKREPKLVGNRMLLGILLLRFIRFHRLGYFASKTVPKKGTGDHLWDNVRDDRRSPVDPGAR